MTKPSSNKLLTCLFLLLLVYEVNSSSLFQEGWFNSIDMNHDGLIDRSEFDNGLSRVSNLLQNPIDSNSQQKQQISSSLYSFFSSLSHGSFWKGFTSGVAMIIATEIGDKTFFIAAVLSMRHDRTAVFGGAIVALIIMTILSSAMGLVLPQFLDRQYTHFFGGILFLYFGVKLLYEARQMEANRVSEELEEVEEELLHRKKDDSEEPDEEKAASRDDTTPKKSKNQISSFVTKKPTWLQIFVQSLTLTFLAEWGDRSQIATIALAAAKNPYGVTVGGCLGHACCTGLAVMGGRMLAARISEKTVSTWGGIIFLVFGLHSIFMET
jgi:Ca2+/H+ antiporter, TMEM165/GDT1 family